MIPKIFHVGLLTAIGMASLGEVFPQGIATTEIGLRYSKSVLNFPRHGN